MSLASLYMRVRWIKCLLYHSPKSSVLQRRTLIWPYLSQILRYFKIAFVTSSTIIDLLCESDGQGLLHLSIGPSPIFTQIVHEQPYVHCPREVYMRTNPSYPRIHTLFSLALLRTSNYNLPHLHPQCHTLPSGFSQPTLNYIPSTSVQDLHSEKAFQFHLLSWAVPKPKVYSARIGGFNIIDAERNS